ncbi:flagellar hook-length control protein FliK [Variovorax sp. GT1P44]|uniref:flagellar hook-length control protein FliK n=1 Tax=Variovorax sp. GT1P44 TaxID=3443742 RepID=UPI003F482F06
MPTLISPSLNVPSSQVSSSGPRGRGAEQAEGRSFGAALDRSRANAAGAQEVAETDLPISASGRKLSRPGEKKSELTAADVMALLAPLPAHLAPKAIDGKGGAADAAKGAKAVGNAVDGITPDGKAAALAADDAATAAATSTDADTAQAAEGVAAAQDDAKDAKTAAKPTTAGDQQFKDALASAAPAKGIDTTATDATTQPAVGMPMPAPASASASKPGAPADKAAISEIADKAQPALQLPAADSLKVAATAEPGGTSPLDAASDTSPQPLPQFQSVAAQATDRANAPSTSTPVLSVAPPVGSDEWGPAIGQQMIRMNASGHQVAELNLNPVGLGPLKVTLTMGDNQAQAMFVSAHESVRKAVEAALPQLRTTLAEQGISLGQTSVGAETRQPFGQDAAFAQQNPSRSPNQPEYPGSARAEAAAAPSTGALSARPLPRSGAGLDTFA